MPKLTIICGAAGVGKSTYGRALAQEQGACFLDSDTATEPVVRAGMVLGNLDPNDRDSSAYRTTFRNPVYECLFAVAAENIANVDVIMVGPFTSEIRDPEWKNNLEARFQVPVEVIFLTCEEAERKKRIEERGNPRDELKLKDWDQYLENAGLAAPCFKHRLVRT